MLPDSSSRGDSHDAPVTERCGMRRLLAIAVLTLLLATGGCSSGGGSSSGTSATASSPAAPSSSSARSPLCDSVAALQASVAQLRNIDVSKGTAGVQQAVQGVQANLQQVMSDAKTQYAPQVDSLKQDASQLRSAVDAAQANPSVSALAAIRGAIQTLVNGVSALADAVKPSC